VLQHLRHLAQNLITSRVHERVVNVLEVIDVYDEEYQRTQQAVHALDFFREALLKGVVLPHVILLPLAS